MLHCHFLCENWFRVREVTRVQQGRKEMQEKQVRRDKLDHPAQLDRKVKRVLLECLGSLEHVGNQEQM